MSRPLSRGPWALRFAAAVLLLPMAWSAHAATEALVVYQKSESKPLVRDLQRSPSLTWLSSATASDLSDSGTAGEIVWNRVVAAPWWTDSAGEKVLVTLDHNATLKAQVWNGSSWGAATTLTTNLDNTRLYMRPFDVAYSSNVAIVVYANGVVTANGSQLAYQTW
ncbi:MAG: hypothetical protein Q7J64_02500, partial [Elusimicrobiota bacterium]|nr:hypothetical protein [Elusimicrobiota bacterium]